MLEAAAVHDGIDARLAEFVERRAVVKEANRYFYLQPTTGPVNHRVRMVDGREMIMLASYSYLGLIGHPRIERAAIDAIERYGTGAGGVRLLTGTNDLHEALEARIASANGAGAVANPSAPGGRPVTRPAVAQRPNAPSAPQNRPSFGSVSLPSASPPGIAARPAPRPTPGGDLRLVRE